MKDVFCERIGVGNCNEQTDRRHRFKTLKDNHYYSSNEYYETQKYKSEYIILIYENDVLNTDTAEHLKDGDSLTFIIDIETPDVKSLITIFNNLEILQLFLKIIHRAVTAMGVQARAPLNR